MSDLSQKKRRRAILLKERWVVNKLKAGQHKSRSGTAFAARLCLLANLTQTGLPVSYERFESWLGVLPTGFSPSFGKDPTSKLLRLSAAEIWPKNHLTNPYSCDLLSRLDR
jgi:hypothetical protein